MQAELIYVTAEDNWQPALHFLAGQGKRRQHPVMMVHGLGGNRLNLDLNERYSIARAVQNRGFDVYILELRGAGLSQPPAGQERTSFEWGFNEYSQADMPAAISAVLNHSKTKQIHGLGHSMGGMLWYCLAARGATEIRSITTLGSPIMRQVELAPREHHLLRWAARLASSESLLRVPLRPILGVAGKFMPMSTWMADGILLNGANCEPEIIAQMASTGINDIPLKMVAEMWQQITGQADKHGPYAYEQDLGLVRTPILSISGNVDRIAPPAAVEAAAYEIKHSVDLRYRQMGSPFGDGADFGHTDLLIGRMAPKTVFPLVADFIEEMD